MLMGVEPEGNFDFQTWRKEVKVYQDPFWMKKAPSANVKGKKAPKRRVRKVRRRRKVQRRDPRLISEEDGRLESASSSGSESEDSGSDQEQDQGE